MASLEATNLKELEAVLKKKSIPHSILIFSSTSHIYDDAYKKIETKINELLPEQEVITINGSEAEPSEFHAAMSTIPMFSTGRTVHIRHASNLFQKILANDKVSERFKRDFENIPEDTYLVVHFDNKKIPATFKGLKTKSLIFNEEKLKDKDLESFLRERINTMGFEQENGVAQLIAEKCSWQSGPALHSLDRLFLYCLTEKKILKADVKEACYDIEGDLYFKLIDAIASGNIKMSQKKLLQHKFSDGNMIFGGLIKLFTESLRFYYLKQSGLSQPDVLKRLGQNSSNSWVVQKSVERYNKILTNYGINSMHIILKKLSELDANLKETGNVEMQKTLLLFFLAFLNEIK